MQLCNNEAWWAQGGDGDGDRAPLLRKNSCSSEKARERLLGARREHKQSPRSQEQKIPLRCISIDNKEILSFPQIKTNIFESLI